jgi:predicted ArsR family transcriptional regulator
VSQIAEALEVSPPAVRRHLDALRADGYVDVKLARHGVGRPAMVYFVTERGAELDGHAYVQLLSRLVRGLEQLDGLPEGSGREVLAQAFAGVAAAVAAEHEAEVRGTSLDERVDEASRALQSEGIVDGWRKQGDHYLLVNGDCPYLLLAAMSDLPCRSDRESIERLIGAHVEQTRRIVDGAPVCEYVVRPEPITLLEELPAPRENA